MAAAQHQPPETLVRTVTRVINAAAEAAIGVKKVLPGVGWGGVGGSRTAAIKAAITKQCECYALALPAQATWALTSTCRSTIGW